MGLFDNKENNVGQFGADDTNIIRYKQAAEYALDAKMYAEYAAEVLVDANNTLNRAEEILAEVREISSDIDEAVAKAEKAVVDANIALTAAQEALIAANNAVDHADQTAEEMKAYTKQITDETKAYSEQQANEAKAVAEQAKIDAIAAADAATLAANNAKEASENALASFQSMSTSAESVPYNQAAEATFNHVTNDMHFKIPKGVDGKISDFGQAETRDPVDSDFVMISDFTGVVNKTQISKLAAMMPVSGFRVVGFWDVPTNVVEDVEYGLNTTVTPGTPPQVKAPDSVDDVQFKVRTAGSFVIQTGEDPIDFAVGDILYWLGSRWYDDRQLITSVNGKRGAVVITKNDVGLDKVPNVDIYSKTESDGKYLNLLGGQSVAGVTTFNNIVDTVANIGKTSINPISVDFQQQDWRVGSHYYINVATSTNVHANITSVTGGTGWWSVYIYGATDAGAGPTTFQLWTNGTSVFSFRQTLAKGSRWYGGEKLFGSLNKPSSSDITGLGTAASVDTGVRPGNILVVESMSTGTDLNDLKANTVLKVVTSPLNAPSINVVGDVWYIENKTWYVDTTVSNVRVLQFAYGYGTSANKRFRNFQRVWNGTTWSGWVEIWNENNAPRTGAIGDIMNVGWRGFASGPIHKENAYGDDVNVSQIYRMNTTTVGTPGGATVYGALRLPCDGGPSSAYLAIGVGGLAYVGSSSGNSTNPTWRRVYTDQFKPTASDVGALPITGGTITGNVTTTGIRNVTNIIETTQNSYFTSPVDGMGLYWRNTNTDSNSKMSITAQKSPTTGFANMRFVTGFDQGTAKTSVLDSNGIFQAYGGFMLMPYGGNSAPIRLRNWGDPNGWANVFEISNGAEGDTETGVGWMMRLTKHKSGAKDNVFNGTITTQDGVLKSTNTALNRTGTYYDDGNINGVLWNGYLKDYLNNAGVSDARLKNNIKPTEKVALSDIDRIQFVDFDWGERYLRYKRVKDVKGGILAQSLEEIDPRYVTVTDTSSTGGDVDERGLDMNNLLSLALQGIQELSSEVKALKAELKSLKEKS